MTHTCRYIRHCIIYACISEYTGNMQVQIISPANDTDCVVPVLCDAISAGFPSPALDFEDLKIDLNRHVVRRPASTFFGRVTGNSMRGAGIEDGDLLVIDKSIAPRHGHIAVCFINGEFTLKRYQRYGAETWLVPENEEFQPIRLIEGDELQVWGVVTFVIKQVCSRL